MPTTVNGIGTRYGGKGNVETFFGVCESCHREVQLSNYETKLWFTVFFIPLIPLGKKQIFNYCPSCTRHGAMPLEQWQGIKQDAVEEQRTAWNQSNDPAAAIQLLETYAAFRQFDEGRDLAGTMANRFANVANVQLALGQFYATLDQNEDSERCFRKAYELEPASPHARHALAVYSLQKDDPVSAERLLRQQPPITVADNPQLHYMLGAAYHRQGRNSEALKTFRSVLEVAPQFGKHKEVRKLIRETEMAAGEQESILPYQSFYRSTPFLVTAGVILLLAVALGWNWAVSRNHTLHIVNGYKVPITVAIDGGNGITVAPQSHSEVKLAEGKHVASVQQNGMEPETIDFDVSASFFDRYFKSPAFILNPGGAAPLAWTQHVYMVNPVGNPGNIPYVWLINKPFVSYPDIDYAFVEPPATMKMKRNERITKSRIELTQNEPSTLVGFATDISADEKLRYAETHLRADPDNDRLLMAYAGAAQEANQVDRVKKFLESNLERRPIVVEWHRYYQRLRVVAGEGPAVLEEYRGKLRADPQNAALLYLVGRMEPRRDDAVKLYDAAIAANPQLFFAKYAKSHILQGDGDFAAARKLAEEAVNLQTNQGEADDLWFKARFANREFRTLEKELRDKIQNEPISPLSRLRLMQVLVAQQKFGELDQLYEQLQQAAAAQQMPPDLQDKLAKPLFHGKLYLQRKLKQMLQEAGEGAADPANGGGGVFANALGQQASLRFAAQLELGQLDEAAKTLESLDPKFARGYWALCLSIAYRQRGSAAEADRWQALACKWLITSSNNGSAVAKLLGQPGDIDADELRQFNPGADEKAILLVAVAPRCGSQKQEVLQLAKKLNYELEFPHFFLEGAIAAEEGRK